MWTRKFRCKSVQQFKFYETMPISLTTPANPSAFFLRSWAFLFLPKMLCNISSFLISFFHFTPLHFPIYYISIVSSLVTSLPCNAHLQSQYFPDIWTIPSTVSPHRSMQCFSLSPFLPITIFLVFLLTFIPYSVTFIFNKINLFVKSIIYESPY